MAAYSLHGSRSYLGDYFRRMRARLYCLGLCPDNRIRGGKILSVLTRHVVSRRAIALRMAAYSLHGSRSHLGDYFRRMRARLGTPAAITAAAHKIARILYHLMTTRQRYDESVFALIEQRA